MNPLDFPFPPTLETAPYYAFFAILGIVVFFIYWFRLKPVVQYPLSKEEDLGYARIYLSNLGKFREGRITTAINHFIENFSDALTTAPKDKQDAILKFRDRIFQKDWLLAQRDGREKIIYLFDANPLDPKFCHREDKGTETPIREIGPILDCGSVGSHHGFEYVWVKLDKTVAPFTDKERELKEILARGLMYIEDAASNSEKLKFSNDRVNVLTGQLDTEQRQNAKLSADIDTCKGALEQQRLSEPGQVKIGYGFGPKARTWFGDIKQYVFAAIGYLALAPLLITHFAADATPPTTTYMTAAITIACFFALPVLKTIAGFFGRWRH